MFAVICECGIFTLSNVLLHNPLLESTNMKWRSIGRFEENSKRKRMLFIWRYCVVSWTFQARRYLVPCINANQADDSSSLKLLTNCEWQRSLVRSNIDLK